MSVCHRKNCTVENLPQRVKGTPARYYITFAWVFILPVLYVACEISDESKGSTVEQNLQESTSDK